MAARPALVQRAGPSVAANPKLVTVHWHDAWMDDSILDLDKNSYLVKTVGWLLRDDDIMVVVAAEKQPDGGYRAVTHIPRSIVKKVEPIA